MRKKTRPYLKVSLIALGILAVLAGWLGFSDRGLLHLYKMELERQTYLDRIESLKMENEKLMREIERLRHDPSYVERLAREELGLVKQDEIIYRFKTLGEPVEKENSETNNGHMKSRTGLSGR